MGGETGYEVEREKIRDRLRELHYQIEAVEARIVELSAPVVEVAGVGVDATNAAALSEYLEGPPDNSAALRRAGQLRRQLEAERNRVSHELGALEKREGTRLVHVHIVDNADTLRKAARVLSEHVALARRVGASAILPDMSGDIERVIAHAEKGFGGKR